MLDALFRARSIAVIGASRGMTPAGMPKLGTAVLSGLIDHGFEGKIYPVNPREPKLMGHRCYANVRDIPGDVDLGLMLVPAEACVQAMDDCAAKGMRAAVVFAAGFAEAGETDLQTRLVAAARTGAIRLCGPNTNGLVNTGRRLFANTSDVLGFQPFPAGDIAVIAQSGGVAGSLIGRAIEDGAGISHWVTTGLEADLTVADYLDYLVDQDSAKVFALFLEGIRDASKFLAACRKAARARKPIVVYKLGLSEVAAAASISHTGALTGSDRVFEGICRQYGLVRVDDLTDLLPTAKTFAWLRGKLPRGNRVGVISPSGGIIGVAADECRRCGLDIPALEPAAQQEVRRVLPSFAWARNPIDLTQQIRATPGSFQNVTRTVLRQDYIDGILVLVTMVVEPRAASYASEIGRVAAETEKPVVAAWIGPESLASEAHAVLRQSRAPNFFSVRAAVNALSALVGYRAFIDRRAAAAAE